MASTRVESFLGVAGGNLPGRRNGVVRLQRFVVVGLALGAVFLAAWVWLWGKDVRDGLGIWVLTMVLLYMGRRSRKG